MFKSIENIAALTIGAAIFVTAVAPRNKTVELVESVTSGWSRILGTLTTGGQ